MRLLLLLAIIPTVMYSQVGIGTTNPQADLHVAGSTSTIRIESLDATNSPTYNDGISLSPAFVTSLGDVTINPSTNNGTEPGGGISPINFLLTDNDFIPNGSNNYGSIVTNPALLTNYTGLIKTVNFTSPGSALVEVKYCISSLISFGDLNLGNLLPFTDISARVFKIYFCLDINNDGLDLSEASRKYGLNAQSYTSANQGILGYSFTTGHGYTTVPAGTHSIHFFAEIFDGPLKITSIGFGGAEDLLKVRVYN